MRESKTTSMVRMKINPTDALSWSSGRCDMAIVDATTEKEIAKQIAQDEQAARQDAAQFTRSVRARLGLTQTEFAARIRVSLDTLRNWEQGKRQPTGAAQALLLVLNKAPEAALAALS